MPSLFIQQRTISRAVAKAGIGLHSGTTAQVRLLPAPANTGVVFVRTDLSNRPLIPAQARRVINTMLATSLSSDGVTISTVEHLMSAIAGLGIDNIFVEVDGPELPILDGSSQNFVELLLEAGIRMLSEPRVFCSIRRSVTVSTGDKYATLSPGNAFRIDCTIDFPHPIIGKQHLQIDVTERSFLREIASARTFGFARDIHAMRDSGLAKGGSLDNAIVLNEQGVENADGLRFPDEFVRHKVLDAVGDLALLGHPILGTFTAFKTGHALNQQVLLKLLSDSSNYDLVSVRRTEAAEREPSERASYSNIALLEPSYGS